MREPRSGIVPELGRGSVWTQKAQAGGEGPGRFSSRRSSWTDGDTEAGLGGRAGLPEAIRTPSWALSPTVPTPCRAGAAPPGPSLSCGQLDSLPDGPGRSLADALPAVPPSHTPASLRAVLPEGRRDLASGTESSGSSRGARRACSAEPGSVPGLSVGHSERPASLPPEAGRSAGAPIPAILSLPHRPASCHSGAGGRSWCGRPCRWAVWSAAPAGGVPSCGRTAWAHCLGAEECRRASSCVGGSVVAQVPRADALGSVVTPCSRFEELLGSCPGWLLPPTSPPQREGLASSRPQLPSEEGSGSPCTADTPTGFPLSRGVWWLRSTWENGPPRRPLCTQPGFRAPWLEREEGRCFPAALSPVWDGPQAPPTSPAGLHLGWLRPARSSGASVFQPTSCLCAWRWRWSSSSTRRPRSSRTSSWRG